MAHDACAAATDARSERRLAQAFALTAAFMAAEIAGGLYSGSLALLADAAHMALDAAALLAALLASRIDRLGAGDGRVKRWAAIFNASTLLPLSGWMVWEAFERLREPTQVLAGPMFAVAVAGLIVNFVAFKLLHPHSHGDANVRAAALHVLGDIFGSVAAIVAAITIATTGWRPIDPLLSIIVAGIVSSAALRLLRGALRTAP